jgi:hypothetical protein
LWWTSFYFNFRFCMTIPNHLKYSKFCENFLPTTPTVIAVLMSLFRQ